jgi:alkylation response protein AidB-like acyl-CoA dehydrogenase
MDFDFTDEEMALRGEVEDFLKKELPPNWDETVIYWPGGWGTLPQYELEFQDFWKPFYRKLGEKAWLSIGWPEDYGGMHSMMKFGHYEDVMSYYRAPSGEIATLIVGPTLVHVASEEMKREWLPRIAKGEVTFFLGYSEPDAGSDLASIQTTAVEDGDDLILNGQKIWSTGAHTADYSWLIARTDPDASKRHKGISLMIVDCRSPGITITPIINVCGIHSFNQVFFDNVRVSKKNIVGDKNRGFYYLMAALQYERLILGIGGFRRILEEVIQYAKESKRNGESLSKNPLIQNKIASMAIDYDVLYGIYWRCAWMIDKGRKPDLDASIAKQIGTELSRKFACAAMEVLGLYGQLDRGSKWAPLTGRICIGYLDSISGPIGAGTPDIMRSIIATRGLGLPRE